MLAHFFVAAAAAAAVFAPMMAMASGDDVKKHVEAALLSVIETVVERLGRVRQFLQIGGPSGEQLGAEPQALDHIVFLVKLLELVPCFGSARRSRLADVAQRRLERRPILFLRRREFQARLQPGDFGVGEGRDVFCGKFTVFVRLAKAADDRPGSARAIAVAAMRRCFFMRITRVGGGTMIDFVRWRAKAT